MKFRAIAIPLGVSLLVLAGIYSVLLVAKAPRDMKADAPHSKKAEKAPPPAVVAAPPPPMSPPKSELRNTPIMNFDDSAPAALVPTQRAPPETVAAVPSRPLARKRDATIQMTRGSETKPTAQAPQEEAENATSEADGDERGDEDVLGGAVGGVVEVDHTRSNLPLLRAVETVPPSPSKLPADNQLRAAQPSPSKKPSKTEDAQKTLAEAPPKEKTTVEPESGLLLKNYGTNPTIDVAAEPISTFAADVDTGSYTLARGYLERNQMPPEGAVRVEEVVNAFNYHYRPPEKDAFAVQVEAFPSPYRKGYHLLHIGLKGREVQAAQRKSANLVFVIDVSGSMEAENRLPMAKRALHLLTDQLREDDSVSVVVYGTTAHTVLEPTWAVNKTAIHHALDRLTSEGSTNVQAGLELGYTMAFKRFKPGGINRVILLSDGVANNGVTHADGIFAKVKSKASEGVTLTTVGFGMGSYNDVLMERLADQGDGHYAYVDKIDEARRLFVEQLTGTLEVIAKDVKLQVEFNPEAVTRYRLLGFENRALNKEDFANDRVDAGELGAGHSVTAIYEVKLKSRNPKYFATFRARFKQPRGGASALIEKSLPIEIVRDSSNAASAPTRLSLVAAGFAEKLRGSYWARNLSWNQLLTQWEELPGSLKAQAQPQELRQLMVIAQRLDRRGDPWEREIPIARMDFDRIPVLR